MSTSYDNTIKFYKEDGDDWTCFTTLSECFPSKDHMPLVIKVMAMIGRALQHSVSAFSVKITCPR